MKHFWSSWWDGKVLKVRCMNCAYYMDIGGRNPSELSAIYDEINSYSFCGKVPQSEADDGASLGADGRQLL